MPDGPIDPQRDEDWGFWPSLAEVLSWDDLDLVLRMAAGETGRRVRVVLSTELVDAAPFLRGGELLLTTGMTWGSVADGARFVRAAARAGVAAIGFGTGPWSEAVPEPLLTAARRASIPVIEVPRSTPFMAIAERVAAEQAGRRASHTESVMLGALMDHVRLGQADQAVLDDHAPFLHVGSPVLAAACHSSEEAGPVLPPGRVLLGRRGRRVLVLAERSALRGYLWDRDITVYGWSETTTARGLRRILGEAWSAYDVARQRGRPASARDLASVGGLVARLTAEQLMPFTDHIAEPLRRHDAIHGTELFPTVEAFVRARGSLAATAQDLFLHVNTVRKRMARVGAILGIEPLDQEGYLVLRLAVHTAAPTARSRPARSRPARSRTR